MTPFSVCLGYNWLKCVLLNENWSFDALFLTSFQIKMPQQQTLSRSPTPGPQQDYDVTRMREEDFERLAVYIVPDVPCERGTVGRAEKTLPRSLTLKPSLVLSTPTTPVSSWPTWSDKKEFLTDLMIFCRRKAFGVPVLYQKVPDLAHLRAFEHQISQQSSHNGGISGG